MSRPSALGGLVSFSGSTASLGVALLLFFLRATPLCACAVEGGSAYQPQLQEVALAMEKTGSNRVGSDYPPLPLIETGHPQETRMEGTVPCVLLKAVGYLESSWAQAVPSVPRGSVGPTKVSPSCGYGIMQITSGMRNPGDLSVEIQERIAQEYMFNVAWGAKMLVDKWNTAPGFTPPVGDRDPAVAENWYYAVWAYNGWLFKNNPNNPDLPWPRAPYDGTQSRTNYPYQELVWGLAAHPPQGEGGPLWQPVPLSLPRREEVGLEPGPLATPLPQHLSPCLSLQASPHALLFLAAPGAPIPSKSLTITGSNGPGNAPWTASASSSGWLSVSPTAGDQVPASVNVSGASSGLRPGWHTGTVTVELGSQSTGPQLVTVYLLVTSYQESYLPQVRKQRPR